MNICNGNSFLSFKALLKFLFGYRSKNSSSQIEILPKSSLLYISILFHVFLINIVFIFFHFVLSTLSVSSLYLGDKLFSVKTVFFSVCTVPNTTAL